MTIFCFKFIPYTSFNFSVEHIFSHHIYPLTISEKYQYPLTPGNLIFFQSNDSECFSPWDSLCGYSFFEFTPLASICLKTRISDYTPPLRISTQKTHCSGAHMGFWCACFSLLHSTHMPRLAGWLMCIVLINSAAALLVGTCIVCFFVHLCCVHFVKIMFNKTKNNICYTRQTTLLWACVLYPRCRLIEFMFIWAQKSFTPLLVQAEHVRMLAVPSPC